VVEIHTLYCILLRQQGRILHTGEGRCGRISHRLLCLPAPAVVQVVGNLCSACCLACTALPSRPWLRPLVLLLPAQWSIAEDYDTMVLRIREAWPDCLLRAAPLQRLDWLISQHTTRMTPSSSAVQCPTPDAAACAMTCGQRCCRPSLHQPMLGAS
jgi:hypothetical protein